MSDKKINDQLQLILSIKNKKKILDEINLIKNSIENKTDMNNIYLLNELDQIYQANTVDRIHYYINRLIKSFTEIKQGKYNDLNLNHWKKYDDILTDSLWLIDKRDSSGEHNAGYWGNFVPQIPAQLIKRYTKKNEWVLDTFLGSGTTMIESIRQNRNCVGIELNSDVVKDTSVRIKR
jgi:DNA modification methylase